MSYQDKWLKGRCVQRGVRECAERYGLVREWCSRFKRPFTVCDIGANMCYFGLRLTEDFQDCTVLAFESDHFKLRAKHVKANASHRLLLLERRLSLTDLFALRVCTRFDLVLAMSLVHHLPGPFNEWMHALRGLGDHVIAEFALGDSRRVAGLKDYRVPKDAMILGYGKSHLKRDMRRPIVLLAGEP